MTVDSNIIFHGETQQKQKVVRWMAAKRRNQKNGEWEICHDRAYRTRQDVRDAINNGSNNFPEIYHYKPVKMVGEL